MAAHAVAMPDGSPGRALHLAAKRHRASLIVVGSAHRGIIGRVLAGDVTMGTLHGAECPVIVAPHGFAERDSALQTIGVGFDGTPESRAAAELARDLATAASARLNVIRVLEPPPPGGPALGYDADWAQRAEEHREEVEAEPTLCRTWGTSPPARSSSAIPRPSWPTPGTSSPARHGRARLRAPASPHARQHVDQARARGPVPRPRAHTRSRGRGRARRRGLRDRGRDVTTA